MEYILINGQEVLVDLSEDEHITEEMMEHWHKIDIEEELY